MQVTAAVSRNGENAPRLESVDLGALQPGEVRIKIVATGICHTDLHFHDGAMTTIKPIVLGHEGAGIIEEIGLAVTSLSVGDHVVLCGGSCGDCASCHAGLPTYCVNMVKLSWSGMRADGSSTLTQNGERMGSCFFTQSSFATHAIAPERTAVKVPSDLPLHLLGPLGCGMITGAGSVIEAFRLRPGQSIAVFGAGGVGLAAVMAARLSGASRIVAIDLNQRRLDLARELGATDALIFSDNTLEGLRDILAAGFDFTFNTTQVSAVFDVATACLAPLGTAGFVVNPAGTWSPDMISLLIGGRKLQGIIGGNANAQTFIPKLIDHWRQGRFPFDRLITEFRFDQIDEAWDQFRKGEVIKPILRMEMAE
jgi:aryl-alcohol dehydrogenase